MASSYSGQIRDSKLRRSSKILPIDFTAVLLGDLWLKKNKVGNLILGTKAFETRKITCQSKMKNEAISKEVAGQNITVVNTADLFDPQISPSVLRQRLKECADLCDPGPHAFILVMSSHFSQTERQRMHDILTYFSDQAFQHSVAFIEEEHREVTNPDIQEIIKACKGRTYKYNISQTYSYSAIEIIQKMIQENKYSHVTCSLHDQADVTGDKSENTAKRKLFQTTLKGQMEQEVKRTSQSPKEVNLFLCGSNTELKSLAAKVILGQNWVPWEQQIPICRTADISGIHVTLVEFPSLTDAQITTHQLPQNTLQCLHLLATGVDAFLLAIPPGPLTDEEKREFQRIQNFFGTAVEDHGLVLIVDESKHKTTQGTTAQAVMGIFKWRYHILDNFPTVMTLIDKVNNMKEKNAQASYTTDMFLSAQLASQLKDKKKVEEMTRIVRELKMENDKLKGVNQGVIDVDNLRIVLLGITGSGKSTTGNTILGIDVFREGFSFESITTECQKESTVINGRPVTVVDTPGLFDTIGDPEETRKEVIKCINMAAPGPHVFLLVITLGRFTEEEKDAVRLIQNMFGDESGMYTLVLFTGGDRLQGKCIDAHLQLAGSDLKKLLRKCGNRYHVIDNTDKSNKDQVTWLFSKIDSMVRVNGGKCYTNEVFQKAEDALKQQQEIILEERKKEIQREKEELQAKHEAEMERLKKEMEEERRRQEEERKRRGEKFKSTEQELKLRMEKMQEKEKLDRLKMQEELKTQKRQDLDKLQEKERESRQREAKLLSEMEEHMSLQRKTFEEEKIKLDQENEEREKWYLKSTRYLIELHCEEINSLKTSTEDSARKQAEREFNEELDRKVKEAKIQAHGEGFTKGRDKGREEGEKDGREKGIKEGLQAGHKQGYEQGHREGQQKGKEHVQAQRTNPGRGVDIVVKTFSKPFKK